MAFADFYFPSTEINSSLDRGHVLKGFTDFSSNGEQQYGVLIDPACDVANEKNDFVKFILTGNFKEILSEKILNPGMFSEDQWNRLEPISKSKMNKATSAIKKFLNGDSITRHYFLPPFIGHETLDMQILDFQQIVTRDRRQLLTQIDDNPDNPQTLTIVAQIKEPFISQIVNRQTAYSARIGSPDYTEREIEEILAKGAGVLLPSNEP